MSYPGPHYDEYDICRCPDHVAMREARELDEPANRFTGLLQFLVGKENHGAAGERNRSAGYPGSPRVPSNLDHRDRTPGDPDIRPGSDGDKKEAKTP